LTREAKKTLLGLPSADRLRIARRIDELALDPHPAGSVKLKGDAHAYRVRQGDYRILYEVRDRVLLVLVLSIGHRRDVYR
jgi:mRNA interferase RelE/StbE